MGAVRNKGNIDRHIPAKTSRLSRMELVKSMESHVAKIASKLQAILPVMFRRETDPYPHLGTVMEAFWATHFLRSIYLKSTSCGLLPLIRFLLLCCIVMTYFDAPKVCTIRLDRLLRVNLITALTDSSCSYWLSGSLISLLGFSPYVLF